MDVVGSYLRVFTVNYVKKMCKNTSYALQLQCKLYWLSKEKTVKKSSNSILSRIWKFQMVNLIPAVGYTPGELDI